MSETVRVRFAPSPTGYLHAGGARSALFNYLFAKHNGGTFILRIEDTDRSRYVEGALQEIYDSLKWLGLEWDEGPEKGGAYGPYVQSERAALYRGHAEKLLASGGAYRCFCTPERLAALREEQEKNRQPAGYDKKCRALSKEENERLLSAGTPHVVRLAIPAGRKIVFNDLIRGPIEYSSDVLDDIILIKSDGFPTYHMANVVDDHLMNITHVMRGDEWISSTPRHVLLYEAFGWRPPQFAHLPVILAGDGKKLSKRKGAASVMDYKRAGYLPEALFNFLALLGWAPGDEREKMGREELAKAFSLERVSPKPAVFDEKKLEWMNGTYLAERSAASLAAEIVPAWKEKGWILKEAKEDDCFYRAVIDLLKVRAKKLVELVDNSEYFFRDPEKYEAKGAKKQFRPETAQSLKALAEAIGGAAEFSAPALEKTYHDYAEKAGIQPGQIIHPTRLAVSGASFGPGLFELMSLLGKETVLRRMNKAVEFIHKSSKNKI
ncbi:MAG: glutamate--tRNA ligase [Chitinispirillaceae bacterium]|nr:glutamate--tRNA ligase [Chitinispirillaceae bacterium]